MRPSLSLLWQKSSNASVCLTMFQSGGEVSKVMSPTLAREMATTRSWWIYMTRIPKSNEKPSWNCVDGLKLVMTNFRMWHLEIKSNFTRDEIRINYELWITNKNYWLIWLVLMIRITTDLFVYVNISFEVKSYVLWKSFCALCFVLWKSKLLCEGTF